MSIQEKEKTQRHHVGCKLSHETYEEFTKAMDATGKSASQVLHEAIAAYLGIAAPPTVPDRLSQLEAEFAGIRSQLQIISQRFTPL
jgi:hypothetical protein